MELYKTFNPVPSPDMRDVFDNSRVLDAFMSADDLAVQNRLGESILTRAGIEQLSRDAMLKYGYVPAGSFESGGTLTTPNQIMELEATGVYYRWAGVFPSDGKFVPAGSTPSSTGGTGDTAWKIVEDISLRSDLADPTGGTLVTLTQGTANAVPIKLQDVIQQSVYIQQYGGKDDYNGTTGTINTAALNTLLSDYPNGCKIKFPRTVGGTGRYYFDGSFGSADMSKYTLDIDPGVDIVLGGANTPLIGPGLVLNRELKILMQPLGYTYRLSPTPYGGLAGKPYVLSGSDGESPVVERAFTNTEMAFNTVNPSTGALTTAAASTDGEYASFGAIPSGQFIVGHFAVRPGWEYHAQVTMPGATASVVAYVQTEGGWVAFCQPIGGGNITRYVFLEGYPVQTAIFSHPLADNPAYNMDVSEIGIKVHSPTSFSLLCNHTEIARMDGLTSNIVRAGWGAGFANNSNVAYISHPVRIKANKTYGMRPLRIVAVGDSTADKNNPFSWVNHMVRIAAGTGGVQFKTVLNQAVAGQTSVQQAAIFNATDFSALGGFDFALIDVGINDIGGGSSADNFVAAIASMISTCITYNIIPIVGLPAMFYNQSAATPYGQTGQGTANADRGAQYRLPLLRKLAELNVQVATLPVQNMGAIIPSLLANSRCDPVVQDNVHQSAWGGELKGRGWAQALVGYLFARTRKDIVARAIKPSWIPSSLSGYGDTSQPSFSIVVNEFSMSGALNTPASVPNGTVVMNLPECYAPKSTLQFAVSCQDATPAYLASIATVQIDTAGAVTLFSVPSTARKIMFGNVRYSLPD